MKSLGWFAPEDGPTAAPPAPTHPHRKSYMSQYASPGDLQKQRVCLTCRQDHRRELETFFSECLGFLTDRRPAADDAADPVSEGIAAFAFEKFGALAANVMQHWGINSPEELEKAFYEYLKACGSRGGTRRNATFSQSDALNALFRGEFWP